MLVKGRITITWESDNAAPRQVDERNKRVIFKNCAPFVNSKSEINNTEIDNAKGIEMVMPMYNLIEYSNNYSKASGILWKYSKDDPNDKFIDSESLKSKMKIAGNTPSDDYTKYVEIIVPLSNFWRALEMLLSNCEVNLILTWLWLIVKTFLINI